MNSRVLLGLALLVAISDVAAAPVAAAPASLATQVPAWVAVSDANTRLLLEAQAKFGPEDASSTGLAEYDGLVSDLGPHLSERYIAAMQAVRAQLQTRLAVAKDENVRQDLQILLDSIDNEIEGTRLGDKYYLDWDDVPQMVFGGLQGLLDDQVPAARRAKAVERLRRYVGLVPGTTPITELAKARFNAKLDQPGLQGPVKARLLQTIDNVPTYIQGIRDLFAKYKLDGAGPALDRLDQQLTDYAAWERTTVLPRAREDFRLPPELYAYRLKRTGIDIDPKLLIQRAEVEFMETRAAMQALAPVVARAKGLPEGGDYLSVLRGLKKDTLTEDQLEPRYHAVNTALEKAIADNHVVTLPKRPMVMRLASPAEAAAQPAPHMLPPALVGNTGEQGQFVLTVGNPGAEGKGEAYDDFNFPAAAWTLSAHEGRPGHELQFSAMIERGVSQARILYAFNSVNVEGWALYAEAEMVPYEPVEGQFIALQFRLLRAARAMLDPMLNLGLIDRDAAGRILTDEVGLSAPMARQELDRYTFRAPAQAGSYFYGYSRLLELRAETELALGPAFNQQAFNDFLLGQGLLPPHLLAKAVREQFIPAQLPAAK